MARTAPQRKRKILLIDDNEVSLHFVASTLREAGYDIRTATVVDGFDKLVSSWAPDAVLTDVKMPVMSGVELCQQLKSSYETAHVPVILFSSHEEDELAQMARTCEADGYLSKVNGLDRLTEELDALMQSILW